MNGEFTNCLLCNSTRLKTLAGYERFHLCRCTDCHFIFCKKIPSEEELISHYKKYNRGQEVSPLTLIRYREWIRQFEPYRKCNRMLDVGCGDGDLLTVAQKEGWEVYGTEFTDEAISVCEAKGIRMKKGVLNVNEFSPESFDVITHIEVLEHINNPVEELKKFRTLLRKGGMVLTTTPNFNSISRRRLKSSWNVLEYPEHLCYYTSETLSYLYKKTGFKKQWLETTGFSVTRWKQSSQPAFNTPEVSGEDEKIRRQIESSGGLRLAKKITNELLTLFKLGDSLKAVFQNTTP